MVLEKRDEIEKGEERRRKIEIDRDDIKEDKNRKSNLSNLM